MKLATAPSTPPRRSRSLLAVAAAVPALAVCTLLQFQPAYRVHAADASTASPAHHSSFRVLFSATNQKLMRGAYPAHAAHARISGWAIVRVIVDAHGHATHAWVVRVAPAHMGFGKAALRVAKGFQYHNPTGHTVVKTLPVKFALAMERKPSPKHM